MSLKQNTPSTPDSEAPERTHPFTSLKYRDYRLMWIGQGISQLGTQMRIAAIGWQIYLLTHDAFQLGLIGIFRVVPLVLCALIGGSAADALDRRKLLIITETALLLFSTTLAVVTFTGAVSVWWIYGLTALTSAANAFENPTYRALVPSLVPRKHLPNAISLNTLNWQTASVIGPGLAGMLIALIGVQGVYILDAFSYCAVIISILLMHHRATVRSGQKVSLEAAMEGLRFVWKQKILISSMLLDFFATFFGMATTLLPIFATDVLHVNEIGFGVLSASTAMGATLASFILAWFQLSRVRHPGIILLIAVFFFSFFTILFGLSTSFPFSVLCLALVGVSDTVSMVLRQTISQLVTPDEMRGRMQSVNMIFFASGPQLGEVEGGIVARWAGAPFSLISGGIACAILVLGVAIFSRQLRNYEFD